MRPEELGIEAMRRIQAMPELDDPQMPVVLPKGRYPRGRMMRVLPGIMGIPACVNSDGQTVVYVSCRKVIAFLFKHGFMRVVPPPVRRATPKGGKE